MPPARDNGNEGGAENDAADPPATDASPIEPRQEPPSPDGGSPEDAAPPPVVANDHGEPVVRRDVVPRQLLDDRAVFVVRRLQQQGHEAYLVGGCVRDLLAGLEPKDFDVATDAYPNRIKRLFRSARVIGRRFRLVHIRFPGNHIIEVSTFRADPAQRDHEGPMPGPETGGDSSGRRNWRDSDENIFGTAPEDAHRRDFTINALYYDPVENAAIDWVGGLEDMEQGLVRSIGNPTARIQEDPVRMLRAVHFAQRMDFRLDPALERAIHDRADSITDASHARLYVELIKMLTRGRARGTFRTLHEMRVLPAWLPELTASLDEAVDWPAAGGGTHEEARQGEPVEIPIGHATWNLLGAADAWGLAAHHAPESLALSVLFGPWLNTSWRRSGQRGYHAFIEHVEGAFRPLAVRMSIPRMAWIEMREALWLLDELRHPPRGRRVRAVLHRRSFPVALALFRLDLMARDQDEAPVDVWVEEAEQAGVDLALGQRRSRPERARRGGRRGGRGGRGRGGRRHGPRRARPLGPEEGAWVPPPPE